MTEFDCTSFCEELLFSPVEIANVAEKIPSPYLVHKWRIYHDNQTNMYLQK